MSKRVVLVLACLTFAACEPFWPQPDFRGFVVGTVVARSADDPTVIIDRPGLMLKIMAPALGFEEHGKFFAVDHRDWNAAENGKVIRATRIYERRLFVRVGGWCRFF